MDSRGRRFTAVHCKPVATGQGSVMGFLISVYLSVRQLEPQGICRGVRSILRKQQNVSLFATIENGTNVPLRTQSLAETVAVWPFRCLATSIPEGPQVIRKVRGEPVPIQPGSTDAPVGVIMRPGREVVGTVRRG